MKIEKLTSIVFLCAFLFGCAQTVSSLDSKKCNSLDSFMNEEGKVADTLKSMLVAYNEQKQTQIHESLSDEVNYIRCDGHECKNYNKGNPYPNQEDWDRWAYFKVDFDSLCISNLVVTPQNRAIVHGYYNFEYRNKPEKGSASPGPLARKGVQVTMSFIKDGSLWKLQDWANSLHKPFPEKRLSKTH